MPTIALLNQWEKEVLSFNFGNILKIGGGNNWESVLANYVSNFTWNIKDDLIIISTYGSFVTDKFQKYFRKIQNEFLFIADEAHNMGAKNIKKTVDPESFEIRDGKLFVFYTYIFGNKLDDWKEGDTKKLKEQADKNWEKLKTKKN